MPPSTFPCSSLHRFPTPQAASQRAQLLRQDTNERVTSSAALALGVRLGTGGIAAVTAQTICQPIETVKVRLQNESNAAEGAKRLYKGFGNGFRVIAAREGVLGLWKGMLPAAGREMSYSSLRFGL